MGFRPPLSARGVQATSLLVLMSLVLLSSPAAGQARPITLDDLYGPDDAVDFSGAPPAGLTWLSDARYLWAQPGDDDVTQWLSVDAASGSSEAFFDADTMEAALADLPGVTQREARRLANRRRYTMNPARTATVLNIGDDLYHYVFGADEAARLTFSPEPEEEISFSPDGSSIAFVRDHDLYVVDIEAGRERALTTDGGPQLLNGKLDWVYQEEIYGRGRFGAYWWSPDSTRLAFLQLNEAPVPEFTVLDHIPYRLGIETWDYPKAGDRNPTVRLGIARIAGGTRWVDTDAYAPVQFLIVNVSWTPDSSRVVYQVQNREQTWLDLNLADVTSGATSTLLRETTEAWVNEMGNPKWLSDGSFLWFSERSGWKHMYHYDGAGSSLHQVTDGDWEARQLHGVDEANGWVYFSGTERSHIGSDIYRVRLDGSDLTRLSQADGTHRASFNPSFTHYLDTSSALTTPPQVRVHAADGREVRVVHEGQVPALADYRLGESEFVQVQTRDGFTMEALMIKPPDFDSSRQYPVYQHTYGGPHAQQVRNAWSARTFMYHQLLAQKGIVVWICDNRTASGKGAVSTWPVYKNFGELELQDIEDGLAWLKGRPYVDGSRIGINGWSYGGFMVSYALTHSTSFAMGIAGGTVSDWRDYDTIYTERYMMMPQNNPDGYRNSSPRFAAKDLHGELLLIHGTIDDNVHMQNTMQLAYELQKAGKPFRLMVYPKARHGVSDPQQIKHMRTLMVEFIEEHLTPTASGAPSPTAGEQ